MTTETPYGLDNAAPGTRLWRLREHLETLTLEDAVRVAQDLDAARAEAFAAGRAAALGPDSIDAAWAAAEAVLPEGWRPLIGREHGGWWATASEPRDEFGRYTIVSTSDDSTLYPTMGAALLALAEMLSLRAAHPAEAEEKPDAV